MHRTILLVQPPSPFAEQVLELVRRAAGLYNARTIRIGLKHPDRPLETSERFFEWGPTDLGAIPESEEGDPDFFVVDDVSAAVFEMGHLADVIVVLRSTLAGADGEVSHDEIANLVRQAPRPVWLIQEPIGFPEHIAVGYDGGVHAGNALHIAADLAETLGAKLSVIHSSATFEQVEQDRILYWARRYAEPYQIEMERVALQGGAAQSIRGYCKENKCDLLVLGATGLSYLRGLLFGSVASQLIEDPPCSVLVVK